MKRNSFIINGIKYPAKDCLTVKKYLYFKEYRLPIPEATVDIATGLKAALIVDGRYFFTGKKYHRMENVPGWAWGFISWNVALVFIGGLAGAVLGLYGAALTIQICANPENSTRKKVLTSLLILPAVWGFMFLAIVMLETILK